MKRNLFSLHIAVFDSVEIQNGQPVGRDEAIQSKDFVHLDGGHKGGSSLANNVAH